MTIDSQGWFKCQGEGGATCLRLSNGRAPLLNATVNWTAATTFRPSRREQETVTGRMVPAHNSVTGGTSPDRSTPGPCAN
jgi:hypothetical protein